MSSEGTARPPEFRLLGPFEADCGGRPVDVGTGKQRLLLAMLLLRINRVVPRDTILDELWDGSPPAGAAASLHSLASRIRRALTVGGAAAACPTLRAREPGYVLEGDAEWVDVHRFEQLVARARDDVARGEPRPAVQALRRALGLWRGDALAGLSDAMCARAAAGHLAEARLTAVEDLADAELASGSPSDAVALLEPHVHANPFRERGWATLMLALYRLGRQSEALEAYRTARRIVVEELGIEPTPALRRLEEQILHQNPELDAPPAESPPGAVRPTVSQPTNETVALLFTDIEASTRRWEGDPAEMGHDLVRHDAVLRHEVEAAGGVVFTHTGDGLAAAFGTASAALTAAIAGQRALLGQRWVAAGELRVRMAVHAGAAERRAGNYFGPTLNRAARLLSITAGGQILCSGAAADLAHDHLPAGVTLVDLGDHGLSDLARPERVFQVAAPGLPSAFPELRSGALRRHNLPRALTGFIGRTSELAELRRLAETSSLVTLTGVGGVGKSRLALQLAEGALDRFPDGVWLVELAPVRDPALVVNEVCIAVGVPQELMAGTSGHLDEALSTHLRTRRVLILLDNCEHVVEASAQLLQTLLAHCPHVGVVVTSREVLGVGGELVWRVPPLSLPPPETAGVADLAPSDAVALFCERAGAAQAGFALSEANVGAVVQICRRLDGIPLALELAAARIRVLSAQQVADRLDDRFRLLSGGVRSAVPRHQTLRAAIDWSYLGLPAAEQRLLRRLSVFPGSFDLKAAEAVGHDPREDEPETAPGFEVLDLLSRLVDKSLVVVQPDATQVRYRLLETVRQYAAERLTEADEALAAHHRHRDHFVRDIEWPARSWHPDNEAWLRRVAAEEDNVRAALAWSLAEGDEEPALQLASRMWPHWLWASRPEGIGWLERALAGPSRPEIPSRADALLALGWMRINTSQPDPEGSERLMHEALEMSDRLGHRNGQLRARFVITTYTLMRGEAENAAQLCTSLLADTDDGDVTASGWCHYLLGLTAAAAGDVDRAMARLEQAHELARRGAAVLLTSQVLAALTQLAAAKGEEQRAIALAGDTVRALTRLEWPEIQARVLVRVAEAAILVRNLDQARAPLRYLLDILRGGHGRHFLADALEMVGILVEAVGRPEAAAQLMGNGEMWRDPDHAHIIIAARMVVRTQTMAAAALACAARLRERLGAERYEQEATEGRRLNVDDAIAYASAELEKTGHHRRSI